MSDGNEVSTVKEVPGVKFNVPPIDKIPSIKEAIDKAFTNLPEGSRGGLFVIANETSANAAIVTRVGNGWQVSAYIGKTWKGSANYGAIVTKTW